MKTIKILFLFVGMLVSGLVSAQTYDLNTNHTSISMKTKNLGWTADIFVTNNHVSDTYIVSYTVEFTLKCGGTKTYTQNDIGIKAGKTDDAGGYTISIPDVKGCEKGISGAKLIKFSADKEETPQTQSSSSSYSSNSKSSNQGKSSNVNNDPKPGPNASVQELAAWQRRQNTVNSTSTATTSSKSYNNYDNNTASPQQTQTTNSNNGVTMADVQKILDENNRQSEQRLGVKSYANDTEMVNDIAKGVGEIVDLIRANRELDRKEEEQKRAAEESRKLEEAAAQQKVGNRKIIINKYQPKDIPVSSKEKASKIYYFIYAYDNTINNLYGSALMYVSNVFEIGTYDDGTRAYTATINNEIANLTSFKEVLHGYYYTEQEAVKIRESFISLMQNNDVYFTDIYYKGKPTTSTVKSNTTKQENFWGETKNDQNLAPAQINTAKPSELPREEKKKQEEKKKKDFWD